MVGKESLLYFRGRQPPKANSPLTINQWARPFKGEFQVCIGGGRGLHAETAQSPLTVVLQLVMQWSDQRHLDCFLFFVLFFFKFIYLFMAVLGLHFCARAFSRCGKRGPLFIAVRRPLTIAASLVAEHRLQTRRLSSCGSRAQSLRGMWDPPRPGLEPVSPALTGRRSTTAPPGKPHLDCFKYS